MRYSTTAVVLAAMSIGEVVAGPTHAHLHRKAHEKKDVDWASLDWDNMGINWAEAYSKGVAGATATAAATVAATPTSAAAVVAEATPASAAAAAATPAASASDSTDDVTSSIESSISELFDSVVGAANSLTSFGSSCNCFKGTSGDDYIGEVGFPYGSNIIKVDSTTGYDFTNTFTNTQSDPITVNVWNKAGYDMRPLSGSAFAPKITTLTFVLASGASQIVAFMENSQVGWAQACSETTASGSFDNTWGEANFLSAGSGYDMSAIENSAGNNYYMKITSLEAPNCGSDPTENYWLTPTEPIGNSDGSCYIGTNTATLTTIMGGTM